MKDEIHDLIRRSGNDIGRFVQMFPCAPGHRPVLWDFQRFIWKRYGLLEVTSLGWREFRDHLRGRLRRGEPVEGFSRAREAMGAFASAVGLSDLFHAAVRSISGALRLTRQEPCWVVEPYFPFGAHSLAASGVPRHGATPCGADCVACRAGVGAGLWWTVNPAPLRPLHVYAESATYRVYQEALHRAEESALLSSRATSSDIEIPAPPGLFYLPFQKAGIAYALEHRATLLGDEMGLGKTIQALGLVNADPALERVLVVCPATLLANWRREAETWLVRRPRIYVCEASDAALPEDAGLVIVGYSRVAGPLNAVLMERSWDLLIADEAHYLKNPDARRTRAVFGTSSQPGLIQRARRLLFMTGTPMLNRPSELLTLIQALDPVTFAPSRIPYDPARLQLLIRQTVMVRRLKADVLRELPPKRRAIFVLRREVAEAAVAEERRVLLHHAQEIRACALARDSSVGNDTAYREAARRLRHARIEAQGGILRARHLVAVAKLPAVLEHCDKVLREDVPKLVVFAHHRDVLGAIAAHYGEAAVLIDGEVPPLERDALVARFQTDPGCRVFVGSLRAAGQGITLTAASRAVFAELDWTPAILSQAEDRCHRIGQREGVLVEHIVVDESIDSHLARMIVSKQALIHATLDAGPDDDEGLDLALAAA